MSDWPLLTGMAVHYYNRTDIRSSKNDILGCSQVTGPDTWRFAVIPKQYTAISLFSGAMGLDIGLENTGRFVTLAAVEKDSIVCQTICRNRDKGRTANSALRVYKKDIHEIDPQNLLAELGLAPGELDLLVGGPPCQSFSTTGKRGSIQDPRGTLIWQFLHFVKVLKPKFFLMENVRGLMSAAIKHRPIKDRPEKGGAPLEPEEKPGSVIELFVDDLQSLDYRLDIFEVNAVNYGAPQLRERVLFFGNRFNHLINFPEPTHGVNDSAAVQSSFLDIQQNHLLPFRTLGEALADLKEDSSIILDFSPRKKGYLALIPPGGNWRALSPEVARESMGKAYYAKGGRSGWWRRLSFDLPSPTIVTMPNHASTSLCHPTELRALTLRECARVQEFPDDWEFIGKTQEQYAQVGNAVPVRLGQVSGEVLAWHLDTTYRSGFSIQSGDHEKFRVVYLQSHIRTRRWYKDGQKFIWDDGEENSDLRYGPAKTQRRVRKIRETNTVAPLVQDE
jgi:DNA (cytosine-5)-methyltransferase 1